MSKRMAVVVASYGLLSIGFAFAIHRIASDRLIAVYGTLVFGLICMGNGIVGWGRRGGRIGRKWVVIGSAVTTFFLITEVVGEWISVGTESSAGRRLLLTAVWLSAFGMVFYSVHAERPPEFYNPAAPQGPGPDVSKGEGLRRVQKGSGGVE